MPNTNPENYRGLTYPWGRQSPPAPGEPLQVAPGVYWVRIPMPMALNHINIWLLEDGDGWTIVDTGLQLPETLQLWEKLLSGFMANRPIKRLICTHMHPDHVGLAGWLTQEQHTQLWMTRSEFLMCRAMVADTGRVAPEMAINFYRAAGYDESQLQVYREKFGNFGRAVYPLPDSYRRIKHGDTITIGEHYWQIVVGSGHSPEHATLYCPALKLLISGDQVLPKITSNISVYPTEPEGDPLQEWLNSCTRLRASLPDDLLVLPSHETPFLGLHVRLVQLIETHRRDIHQLYDYLSEPRRAVDCFPALFQRTIDAHNLGLATGETLAHLNYLKHSRRATCEIDNNGIHWYRQIPASAAFD